MNLGDLKRMLRESFMRSDLEHNYAAWINRGLRKIQQDEDWGPMRSRVFVSISTGQSSVSLPAEFKAFTSEQFPIHVRNSSGAELFPCDLITFEKSKRYRATTFFPPLTATQFAARSGVPVYLDQDGETFSLNLAAPAAENLEFLASCYAFQPDLAQETDTNFLTRSYPDLVEARVKATAFSRVNEFAEMVPALEAQYRQYLREAKSADVRQYRQGRPLRMGG